MVILSTSTSTQIPSHKTSQKKKERKKEKDKQTTHSKQVFRQGKLRKITKCLLARFS